MDAAATQAIIAGLSGVGGAIIGAGATILADRRAQASVRAREHDDALVGFWAAAAAFAHLWGSVSDLLPADSNLLEKLLQGVQLGGHVTQILERQFAVSDRLFTAMGRVRLLATRDELEVINAIEDAIGEWSIGHPMPDSFRDALPKLRRVIEVRGLAS